MTRKRRNPLKRSLSPAISVRGKKKSASGPNSKKIKVAASSKKKELVQQPMSSRSSRGRIKEESPETPSRSPSPGPSTSKTKKTESKSGSKLSKLRYRRSKKETPEPEEYEDEEEEEEEEEDAEEVKPKPSKSKKKVGMTENEMREGSSTRKPRQEEEKIIENKWNFGVSSFARRRRTEMMELYIPKADKYDEHGNLRLRKDLKNGTIRYDMELIHPFVICRLCDSYLIDATTIIDCMHTFCKSCLLLYFENDANTCPTCGILIHGSHPAQYVTYDRVINDLVMKLVPHLEKREKQNRKNFLDGMKKLAGIDGEAEEKAKQKRIEEEKIKGTNRCYKGKEASSHHRDDNQVVVKLIPGTKTLPLPPRPFIRTSEMTTINSLKKYLALAIWDDQNKYSRLDVFCDNQLMGKDFSIRFVWMMKRRSQPKHIPLELEYRITDHD